MDQLAENLANSFSVSNEPNTTDAPHPRFSDYKKKTSGSDQEGRRKDILEQQRNRRFDYMNHARRLLEDDWQDSDDLEDDEGDQDATMDTTEPAKRNRRTHKPGRYYRNQLMLSEWMIELPDDFEENWLMVTCPWGKRCLVVSAQGATNVFGRNGYRVNSFPSHLPGGNRQQKNRYRDNVIMDCIFHEVEKTFYVLDIMNWNGHPVYDSETDFRFFWMVSKMQEIPEVATPSKLNPYKFIPVTYHACKKETLKEVFDAITQPFDGCLFYHKQAHYTFGRSPLVVWLKPYMVQEMTGIEVPDVMMTEKPANYTSYSQHIQQVKETREKYEKEKQERIANRKAKRAPDRSRQLKMDLMESRWFTGVPERFDEDWTTVVCPVGQRCLVMAVDGETKWFSKKGHKLPGYFLSVLPGGNGTEYGFGPTVVTLLDCVYYEEMMTYFIVDAIKWEDHDLTQTPYDERMKWVKQKIAKKPELKHITPLNMFRFCPLYQYECTREGLDNALRQTSFEIDGLLFFKKDCPYVSGDTEEVLWTKPYILPDIFAGIAVPKGLMMQKPNTYTDFETFVDDVQNGRVKSAKNRRKKSKKEFVPTVNLQLPPPKEKPLTKKEKLALKKKDDMNTRNQYRRNTDLTNRANWGWSEHSGQGPRGDNSNRRGMGGRGAPDPQFAGKGLESGYHYYGDQRDFYYPSQGYMGRDGRPGKHHGKQYADPYNLGDMEAALAHYDFDRSGGPGRAKQSYRRQYQLF